MSFFLNTRKVDGVIVMDMSGALTIGEPVMLLRSTVRRFTEDGNVKFIFNLGDVHHIDSAGLGELVASYTTLRNRQGDVKLLNLTVKAKNLLQMTKLLTVFDVFDDEQKALGSLRKTTEQ